MKKMLLFALVACLTQIACQPEAVAPLPTSLNGTWRMVLVKDNASGITTIKSASLHGDVDITFTSASSVLGSFNGNTPTNDLEGNYAIGSNQTLSIPVMSMTKVAETTWGDFFVDHIRSSEYYSFEAVNLLTIRTTKMTLTFQKL